MLMPDPAMHSNMHHEQIEAMSGRADEFLDWLFSDISKRPPKITSDHIPAIRYLNMLSTAVPSGAQLPGRRPEFDSDPSVFHMQKATRAIADILALQLIDDSAAGVSTKAEAEKLIALFNA